MKVLFVIENYLPHIGGVEMVFKNLAEGLVKAGHTATILTHRLNGTTKEENLNGVKIKRVDCLDSRNLFTFLAIPAAISAAKDADIIHTTTFNGFLPAWIAAKVSGKPLVATIHEVWIGKWHEYGGKGTLNSLPYEIFERLIYALPAVDKYVAVSNSTRQQLLKIGKKNAVTIYNGLDYSHFNPKKYSAEKIRKKHSLQRNYVLLVYGRPGPSKGIEHAIAAMKEISAAIPSAKMMLILSKDRQYAKKYLQLLQLIKKLQLEDKIVNIPPAPHSQLPEYIKAADCVIVPSLSEGFGYTAAEASTMGKVVIASNTTSLPEVVSGKHILVQPADSHEIAAAVESAYKGGYHKTPPRKFTIRENVDSYVDTYLQLLRKQDSKGKRQKNE
ncbi:glycosyltransferase family 4 protein [Candidatus Woesearchaeota archaeon]|nr:glycosyltransferase family 4 protein [Candidatus Woesearchaeota archaeon]